MSSFPDRSRQLIESSSILQMSVTIGDVFDMPTDALHALVTELIDLSHQSLHSNSVDVSRDQLLVVARRELQERYAAEGLSINLPMLSAKQFAQSQQRQPQLPVANFEYPHLHQLPMEYATNPPAFSQTPFFNPLQPPLMPFTALPVNPDGSALSPRSFFALMNNFDFGQVSQPSSSFVPSPSISSPMPTLDASIPAKSQSIPKVKPRIPEHMLQNRIQVSVSSAPQAMPVTKISSRPQSATVKTVPPKTSARPKSAKPSAPIVPPIKVAAKKPPVPTFVKSASTVSLNSSRQFSQTKPIGSARRSNVDSVANSNAKTEKSINQNSSENSDSSIAIVESVSLPDPVQTSFIYQLGSNCDTVDSTTSVHADTNEIDDISNADEHEPGNLDSNDEHVEPVLETESVNSNMLDEDIDRCDDVQFNAFGDDALDEADIQDSADSQIVNLSDPIPVDASPFLDSALEINPSEMIDSQLDHPHLDTSESELESVSLTDSNFEVNAIDLNAPEIALSSERIATPVDETSNTASLVQSSAQTDSISTESAREVIVESRFVASIPNSTSKLEIKASVIKPAAFRPVSARLIAPTASLLAHRRPVEPEPVPVSKPCSLPKEFVPEIARARALPDLNPTPPDYRHVCPSLDHLFPYSNSIPTVSLAESPTSGRSTHYFIQHRQHPEVYQVVSTAMAMLPQWSPVSFQSVPIDSLSTASNSITNPSISNTTSNEDDSDWPKGSLSFAHLYSWSLLWTWGQCNVSHHGLLFNQRINHFPGSRELTRKDCLHAHIRRMRALGPKFKQTFDIAPETFSLPLESNAFLQSFYTHQMTVGVEHNVWIHKPAAESRGRGIFVSNDVNELIDSQTPSIVQRYILEPFLLCSHKFDLRIYVVVTSFRPLEAFLYTEGFARISTVRYSNSPDSFADRFVHLTNAAVQRENSVSSAADGLNGFPFPADPLQAGGTKLSLAYWRTLMTEQGIDVDSVWLHIQSVILKTLYCVQESIPAHPCAFELYGFDIMLDQHAKPWLLEVNASPSFECDSPLDWQTKSTLVADIVRLIDPLPINLPHLHALLSRRAKLGRWFHKAPRTPEEATLWTNQELSALLDSQVPRAIGQMPSRLGLFECIAPSPLSSKIEAIVSRK